MHRDPGAVKEKLRTAAPAICPSLLQCAFGKLAAEIADAERCGANAVHWDVMDGHFVPNLTYGPPVIASLRPESQLIFDVHLMLSQPENLLDAFLAAGCDIVTVHLEAVPRPGELLRSIRQGGALAGLAINPPTPAEMLEPWLHAVDLALIMSVMPGFGGQQFDEQALSKLNWVRRHAPADVLVEVDGGINGTTSDRVVAAGAQLLVVGSAFFLSPDRQQKFEVLNRLARKPLKG
jgi:ribulose-phosphate 3-epimerase